MSERGSWYKKPIEKAAEFSKTIDKIVIAIGSGIYVLVSPAIGLR